MRTTAIEWTDATWNPIRGCSRVSEGCRNCYAEKRAYRFSGPGQPYEGLVQFDGYIQQRVPKWNGQIKFVEDRLLDPLKWKKPRRIFVNSMSDLFHENVTDEMLDRIFAVMALSPQHTFQVLTKRPERMLAYLSGAVNSRVHTVIAGMISSLPAAFLNTLCSIHEQAGLPGNPLTPTMPLANVWLGVSVENQKAADERIPLLLGTPAAVRFISVEPLLGPVNLDHIRAQEDPEWYSTCLTAQDIYWTDAGEISDGPDHGKLDWVIVGGESGPGARPMHPDWARSLRDQCVTAGVPFFFKQWGEWLPAMCDGAPGDVQAINASDDPVRVGKKAAGRLLDGREWNEYPEVRS